MFYPSSARNLSTAQTCKGQFVNSQSWNVIVIVAIHSFFGVFSPTHMTNPYPKGFSRCEKNLRGFSQRGGFRKPLGVVILCW
jgi:hypothetical protein